MSKLEIIGVYLGDRFVFENSGGETRTIIGTVSLREESAGAATKAGVEDIHRVSIKGKSEPEELQHGCCYRFFGRWKPYKARDGRVEIQFAFDSFVLSVPHGRHEVVGYLAAMGKGRGIGPKKAAKLVDEFGPDDALAMCRNYPDRVAELINVRDYQAKEFADVLESQAATEHATLEVAALFEKRGFPKTLAKRVIKEWKNRAAEIIRDDPYCLMHFRGVGFRLCDKLYISLGGDPRAINRQGYCLWHLMNSDRSGHTWFRAVEMSKRLHAELGGQTDIVEAIRFGRRIFDETPTRFGSIAALRTDDEELRFVPNGGKLWISQGIDCINEQRISNVIATADEGSTESLATRFNSITEIETRVLRHAICGRCGRQLISEEVHVLDGTPFGPTCIQYVDTENRSECLPLAEWLEANPETSSFVHDQPSGVIRFPSIDLWPSADHLEITIDGLNAISDHQRTEAAKAMSGSIGLLGGSPGTGKTTVVASIIRAILRTGRARESEIIVGAPTGKAAVRLTESLSDQGVGIRARTWHSHLGVAESGADGWTFRHNASNPWEAKILIGDESSMPDNSVMASVLDAKPRGAKMLLVGDVNQLPPVGAGAPFRDLIAAGLPYGELTEIKRNSGGIVEACAKIRDRLEWTQSCDSISPDNPDPITNLCFTDSPDEVSQIRDLLHVISREKEVNQIDPVWDHQVLCAVNDSGGVSRKKLNEILQEALNLNPKERGRRFRVGDKVVCNKNGFVQVMDRPGEDASTNNAGEVYVANGELGKVLAVRPHFMEVALESPARLVKVLFGKTGGDGETTGCDWDLGYALSCHKYQGSEQKVVSVIIDSSGGAKMVCDRAWIYTAISRAKQRCYLVGRRSVAASFCNTQKIASRNTLLRQQIEDAIESRWL